MTQPRSILEQRPGNVLQKGKRMDSKDLVTAYRLMLTSRAIDDECAAIIASGGSVPNYHSGRGQEALATGVGLALTNDDYLQFGYRDFGMLLAKGVTVDE